MTHKKRWPLWSKWLVAVVVLALLALLGVAAGRMLQARQVPAVVTSPLAMAYAADEICVKIQAIPGCCAAIAWS